MPEPYDDLVNRIRALDEPSAVEAAQLLGTALGVEVRDALNGQEMLERPLEHRKDIGDLCRIALLVATDDPDTRGLVEESLAGTGRKQLVLGGGELVSLAVVALGTLQVCLSRGRLEQEETFEIKRNTDGTEQTFVHRKIRYGISAHLGDLLRSTKEDSE